MVNIRVPSSDFDTVFRKSTIGTPSEAYFNYNSNVLQVDQFKRKIENKTQYIKNSCKNTISRFKDDMEKFKQSRNKSFEVQHLHFRKMKKQKHFKINNKSSDKLLREKLNINSISHGLLDNTFNPKRCHYVNIIKDEFDVKRGLIKQKSLNFNNKKSREYNIKRSDLSMNLHKQSKIEGKSRLNFIKQQIKVNFENKYSVFQALDKNVKKTEPKLKNLIKNRKTLQNQVVKSKISEKFVKETINHYSKLYLNNPVKRQEPSEKENKRNKTPRAFIQKTSNLFLKPRYKPQSVIKINNKPVNRITFIKLLNNNFRSSHKTKKQYRSNILKC